MNKVKILLDADVVIDFIDGQHLFDLPKVLPTYDFVILDLVMTQELGKHRDTKQYIERQLEWFKSTPNLSILLDLIWYAWRNGVMSEDECDKCIQDAIAAGNNIPNVSVAKYTPTISNL